MIKKEINGIEYNEYKTIDELFDDLDNHKLSVKGHLIYPFMRTYDFIRCLKYTLTKRKLYWIKYGYDSREIWNIYKNIALFILPRLKYLKKNSLGNSLGYPATPTERKLNRMFDEMIRAFEITLEDFGVYYTDPKIKKDVNKGFRLFDKYFTS